MTQHPEPDPEYYPPPDDECDESPMFPIIISAHERITGRASIYRGKVVDFSLSINIRRDERSNWIEIARIDCKHSNVHEHRNCQSGREATCTKIRDIPGGSGADAWDVVDTEFDNAIELLTSRFEEHVRNWEKS